jgi:hypothetical protein
VADRKEKADRDRTLTVLHQFARDVVDRGDMVGVDRVAQTEAIGQQAGAEQQRMAVKSDERPDPGANIEDGENAINGDDASAQGSLRGTGLNSSGHDRS